MVFVSVLLFANTAVQLLQLPTIECFLMKRFPMTLITLDIPHFQGQSNFSVEDNSQAASSDSQNVVNGASNEFNYHPVTDNLTNNKKCPSCVCGTVNRKMRIVGGVPTEQNEFPWMVALSRKGKFYCGATIITRQHLLTAAHCVEGFTAKEIRASLGEYNRAIKNETHKISVRIKEIVRHPQFQISNFKNDIAILKLDTDIVFNSPYIQPACLPSSKNRNYTGLSALVTGWGRISESKPPSNEMRKVEVPILSIEDCRKNSGYVPTRITDNMMCAGYSSGQKDSCQGDSGGPLQIPGARAGTMEVIGIVSWGRGCARPRFPGVYTKIESYMEWLDSNIEEECSCKG